MNDKLFTILYTGCVLGCGYCMGHLVSNLHHERQLFKLNTQLSHMEGLLDGLAISKRSEKRRTM